MVEDIVVEDIFFPNAQAITVGIFYRPPNQNNFLDIIQNDFHKLNTTKNEVYILGDININLGSKNSQSSSPLLKHYKDFLCANGLKQLIKSPTRVTCDSSSIIDHIMTNSTEKVSAFGVIDVGISDHEMIFCTRKLVRNRPGIKKYINARSLKNYSPALLEEALKDLDFPNYQNFDDVNTAYTDFVGKLSNVIDSVAPIKQSKIKNNSQEWFDREIAESIALREKHHKTFKKTKLQTVYDIFKASRNDVIKLIKRKKRIYI